MKKYLVIGNPIEHSLSPKLHNHWLKENNIHAVYEKKQLNENEIKEIINEVKKEKINGINVTVPFKKSVISFVNELTPFAKETQSVNTIYKNNNKIVGHNTDINGFELALRSRGFNIKNKKIFILGAGGVVPSIILSLKKLDVRKIIITNRTKTKAENLKKFFTNLEIVEWGTTPDFDMIINATSLGLKREIVPGLSSYFLTDTIRIILIFPNLSLGVRRLHDINKSGLWVLLSFTIIGFLPLFYWYYFIKGDDQPNQYGDKPIEF